jgi:hypothetical protein
MDQFDNMNLNDVDDKQGQLGYACMNEKMVSL